MNLKQKVEFFLVVPIVEMCLAAVIISAARFVIREAAVNVNFYQVGLRHAAAGKQSWRMNARVVWIRYLPAQKYAARPFVVGYMLVRRHAMSGNVHRVRS